MALRMEVHCCCIAALMMEGEQARGCYWPGFAARGDVLLKEVLVGYVHCRERGGLDRNSKYSSAWCVDIPVNAPCWDNGSLIDRKSS
jgi:hypothetical protein